MIPGTSFVLYLASCAHPQPQLPAPLLVRVAPGGSFMRMDPTRRDWVARLSSRATVQREAAACCPTTAVHHDCQSNLDS